MRAGSETLGERERTNTRGIVYFKVLQFENVLFTLLWTIKTYKSALIKYTEKKGLQTLRQSISQIRFFSINTLFTVVASQKYSPKWIFEL